MQLLKFPVRRNYRRHCDHNTAFSYSVQAASAASLNMSLDGIGSLATNVHRMSVTTLTSLHSSHNILEVESEKDRAASDLWQRSMSAIIRDWVGSQISSYTSNDNAYTSMLCREFGQSVAAVTEAFLQEEVFLRCPYFKIKILDKLLDKGWEKIKFECRLNDSTVGLHDNIILDSASDVLKIFVWKKKTQVTKEKSLLGLVTIPLQDIGTETSSDKWPIVQGGNSPIGWLKVELAFENRDKPPVFKVLPALLSDKFQSALFNVLQSGCLDVDLRRIAVKYSVQVRKVDESSADDAFSYVEFLDRKLSQDIVQLPLMNISSDSLTLVVESKLGKSSKRTSIVPKWTTPSKKERRTSREMIIDSFSQLSTLDANAALTTYDDSKAILVSSIPWKGGLTVQQKEIQWTIRLVGELKDGDVVTALDMRAHFKTLYDSRLSSMTGDELLEWDGALSPDQLMLETVSRPFYEPNRESVERTRSFVLIELHRRYEFNNEIVHQALCELAGKDETRLDELEQLEHYTKYCIRKFCGSNTAKNSRQFYGTQLRYIAQSLRLIIPREEGDNLSKFKSSFRQSLKVTLQTLPTDSLLPYLNDHVSLLVEVLNRHRQSPHFLSKLLVQSILDEVESLAPPTFGTADQNKNTYQVYMVLLQMCEKTLLSKDSIYSAFERYLPIWSDLAILKVTQQVERVLAFEREHHGNSAEYWDDFSEQSVDWLEGAINVQGIFDTCHNTWKQAGWPNPVKNIEFGTTLFKGTHKVFKQYVADFLEIVTADGIFDKHEFVIILFSVLMSRKYLRNFFSSVNTLVDSMEKVEDKLDLKSNLSEFSSTFSHAVVEADDAAESIVLIFCESQRNTIKRFLADAKMEPEDGMTTKQHTDYLLPYLDNLMDFLYDHLDTFPGVYNIDGEEVKKFRTMLTSHLFAILDEEIKSAFSQWKDLARKKGSPDVFAPLVNALPSLIEFRKVPGLPDSEHLREIEKELYPRSTSSAELVFKQIQVAKPASAGSSSSSLQQVPSGEVCFRACYVEEKDRIRIELVGIKNVVPREGDKENNFSVTVSVMPLTKEPFILRQKTRCYHKVSDVIFDDKDPSSMFTFDLPSNSYDSKQTVIQLDLYHQIPYTFQKVFRGSTILNLDEVQIVMSEHDLRFVTPQEAAFSKLQHSDSEEYLELLNRKDVLAKTFLDRYNRQRLMKYFFENQDWAKIDDSQITCRLISNHLEELVEHNVSKPDRMRLGAITLKIAFHEVLEEVLVELDKVTSIVRRLDEDDLNLRIGVRILPTAVHERLTHVYPKVDVGELKVDDGDGMMRFKLRSVNYNYHKSFVQVIVYDNTRKSMLGSKGERFFRGHILLALSDVHPIDSSDKFRNVAPKKYSLHTLDYNDSDTLKEIRRRKDVRAKEYVAELDRFRDGLGIKVPFDRSEWKEPAPVPVSVLIARHLDKVQLLQHDQVKASAGLLKYLIGYHERTRLIHVDLKSIAGLVPLSGDDPSCNFSVCILVLPSSAPPFILKEKTIVYVNNSTCLLFDLLEDEEDPEHVRHKRPWRRLHHHHHHEKETHKFVFDLKVGNFVAEETFVLFELFLHRRTRRFFRGSFLIPLPNVVRVHGGGGGGGGGAGGGSSSKPFDEMSEMSSHFTEIPQVETEEFLELETRRGEAEAKQFVDRYNRNKEGKTIYTFFPSF